MNWSWYILCYRYGTHIVVIFNFLPESGCILALLALGPDSASEDWPPEPEGAEDDWPPEPEGAEDDWPPEPEGAEDDWPPEPEGAEDDCWPPEPDGTCPALDSAAAVSLGLLYPLAAEPSLHKIYIRFELTDWS